MRTKSVPWLACAAIALACVPALAWGQSDPPLTAAITTEDVDNLGRFRDKSQPPTSTDSTVEIAPGGTVTFDYLEGAGTQPHNVDFDSVLQPTSCTQTKFVPGSFPAPVPP